MEEVDTVVVTRHSGTIEYLAQMGIIPCDEYGPRCQIIEHATADDIRGKHVIGMLPYHMAAEALDITVVDLDVPAELRGVELTLEQVERYATGISTFRIERTQKD